MKLWGSAPRNPEELHPYREGRVVTGGLPAGRATLRPPFHSTVTSAQGEGLQLWGEATDAHGGPKSLVCPLVSWPSLFASIHMTPGSLWVAFSRGEERYYSLAPQSKTRLPINPHADTAPQDHSTPEAMAKPAQGGRRRGAGGGGR